MGVSVAIAGATGAVGQEMISTLVARKFPADEIRLLASSRSKGRKISVGDAEVEVQELTHERGGIHWLRRQLSTCHEYIDAAQARYP